MRDERFLVGHLKLQSVLEVFPDLPLDVFGLTSGSGKA
jgi:hypothetical protein